MLQWDMIFVLQVGMRSWLRISAIISNLLRFVIETFLIFDITIYLSEKSKRLPRQTVINNLSAGLFLHCISSAPLIRMRPRQKLFSHPLLARMSAPKPVSVQVAPLATTCLGWLRVWDTRKQCCANGFTARPDFSTYTFKFSTYSFGIFNMKPNRVYKAVYKGLNV